MSTSTPSARASGHTSPGGGAQSLASTTATQTPTPAQAERFVQSTGRNKVDNYLPVVSHDGANVAGKCEWTLHGAVTLPPDELGAVAWVLINEIMRARCGAAASVYDLWRSQTLLGTKIAVVEDHEQVLAFASSVFLTSAPGMSQNGLQGHVAEWLWHLLTRDSAGVRLQPEPKGDVTDGGGDGHTVYQNAAGDLRFRLWESKKYAGGGRTNPSLNRAYKQLRKHGARYVAKIVGAHQSSAPDITALVSRLPAAWARGDQEVGVGVALATKQPLPSKPFKNMGGKLPRLDKPGQLRGLATAVTNFEELAALVREYAWTAL